MYNIRLSAAVPRERGERLWVRCAYCIITRRFLPGRRARHDLHVRLVVPTGKRLSEGVVSTRRIYACGTRNG